MHGRRCNFFEDDGRPRRLINGERGCPRKSGNCRFVHPNDPDWSSLPPSAPPPNRYLEFDEDDPNSTDRDQMPRKIPPLLLRHRPFRRSQSPIPPSSPSFSHRGSGGGDRTIDRRDSRVDDDPRTRIRDDRSKSNHFSSHPTPQTLPPPPPLPTAPSFLSSSSSSQPTNNVLVPKPAPTTDEKRNLWSERLKHISMSVQAHSEYKTLTAELENCRRLTNSWNFAHLPEEDRIRLRARVVDLESRSQEKKKLYDTIIAQLVETEVWPIAKRPEDSESGYNQLFKYVAELRDTVTEMNALLHDMIAQRNIRISSEQEAEQDHSRPSKRRRLSTDRTISQGEALPHLPPDSAGLEQIQDKLTGFEESLSNFENNLTQHDRELGDELDSRLAVRLDELRASGKVAAAMANKKTPPSEAHSRALREIELNINTTGDQISELAEEVGNLILQSNSHDAVISQLKQENDELKSQFLLMEQKQKEYMERQEKHEREMNALTAAFAAHLARPPSPPPSPLTVPPEYILESVGTPIMESILANVQPMVDDLRKSMDEMLRTLKAEVYEMLCVELSQRNQKVPNNNDATSATGQAVAH